MFCDEGVDVRLAILFVQELANVGYYSFIIQAFAISNIGPELAHPRLELSRGNVISENTRTQLRVRVFLLRHS